MMFARFSFIIIATLSQEEKWLSKIKTVESSSSLYTKRNHVILVGCSSKELRIGRVWDDRQTKIKENFLLQSHNMIMKLVCFRSDTLLRFRNVFSTKTFPLYRSHKMTKEWLRCHFCHSAISFLTLSPGFLFKTWRSLFSKKSTHWLLPVAQSFRCESFSRGWS